ncbi:unnamed protein product, partial [Sphacelaria rigidula]
GTGKSTTIWHVINSRVASEGRTMVTCTRNQAIDAVTRKVESFGVLVFGAEARLGEYASGFTISGRMKSDPELVFWRKQLEMDRVQQLKKRGRAAGLWVAALTHVLRQVWMTRLKNGDSEQRRTYKQVVALKNWRKLLKPGLCRTRAMLARLENLTRYRIYTQTKVLLCTVDSSERMVREMEDGTRNAAQDVGSAAASSMSNTSLNVDTAIMDEAACVLETAVPVILALGVNNLTLIGDQHQLRPFSQVREDGGGSNHCRSLMERALEAGAAHHFLEVQYRMHPTICEV